MGKYTYCDSSGRSVVDYMLCKQRDFSYITNFEVLPGTIYSDHCQLQLFMKFQMKNITITKMCLYTECSDGIMRKLMLIKTN